MGEGHSTIRASTATKKKKGSKDREKQRVKLAEACGRLVNERRLHKPSRSYVNYGVMCVEELNIRNMVRNHDLAQKNRRLLGQTPSTARVEG